MCPVLRQVDDKLLVPLLTVLVVWTCISKFCIDVLACKVCNFCHVAYPVKSHFARRNTDDYFSLVQEEKGLWCFKILHDRIFLSDDVVQS